MKWGFAGVVVMLAACAGTPETAPSPAGGTPVATQPTTPEPAEPLDPFDVVIAAERWGVLISMASDGVIESGAGEGASDDMVVRADRAVKDGAAAMVQLRNLVCARRLVEASECNIGPLPSWVFDPPSGATPLEEIARRSDWLGEAMGPFVDAGCRAAREGLGDELACSVE